MADEKDIAVRLLERAAPFLITDRPLYDLLQRAALALTARLVALEQGRHIDEEDSKCCGEYLYSIPGLCYDRDGIRASRICSKCHKVYACSAHGLWDAPTGQTPEDYWTPEEEDDDG
jgi:hypothetical protein